MVGHLIFLSHQCKPYLILNLWNSNFCDLTPEPLPNSLEILQNANLIITL